jgi:hypothetical protein
MPGRLDLICAGLGQGVSTKGGKTSIFIEKERFFNMRDLERFLLKNITK